MGKEKAVRTDPGGTMSCLFRTWHAPHAGSESDLTACYLLGVPRPTVRTLSQFQAVSSSVKIYFGCRGRICTFVLSGMNRTDYCFPTLRYRLSVSQSPAGCFPLAGEWVGYVSRKALTMRHSQSVPWRFPFSTNTAGDCCRRGVHLKNQGSLQSPCVLVLAQGVPDLWSNQPPKLQIQQGSGLVTVRQRI